MRMKIAAIILLALLLTSTSCSSMLTPTALAADTQTVVSDVKASSIDAFNEIQQNINDLNALKDKVQQAQMSGQAVSMDSVVKDMTKITESFESLAKQKDDIRKSILQKIANLVAMRDSVESEIGTLQQRKAGYLEQISLLDNSDPEIYRTSQKALSKAASYTDEEIQIWRKFGTLQDNIITETFGIERKIDLFLSMIQSSAILFREGLNLLTLQRDVQQAISLFSTDIPTMNQLISDMEHSWDTLDFLVTSLAGVSQMQIK